MSLQERLDSDLKDAIRGGDTLRRSVIRLLRSEVHNEEIARHGELDDDAMIGVLSRQAQQRRDSIEMFAKGNRQDLVEKEKRELAILLDYLPPQMSQEEIAKLVKEAVAEVQAQGPKDMGRVMGWIMPRVKGRAEGAQVSSTVSEVLGALAP